jgi:hypothetical protein
VRRSKPHNDPELLRQNIIGLLDNFGKELELDDLRQKVCSLVPAFHKLRDLGASLIPHSEAANAMDRIIAYLRKYPKRIINGDELMVVSGIGEWARRVRELRVEQGWRISSGVLFKEIAEDEPETIALFQSELGINPLVIKADQYVLTLESQDRDAAHRWHMLNEIRKNKNSVREKILEYLRRNVGREIPGDELRYLAKDAKEWARRTRELRTEFGWPVKTKNNGRPDLAVGVYVLEDDRQAPPHDRKIPDPIRVAVLTRDGFQCTNCGWHRGIGDPDDPRKMLELHHITQHKDKGGNTVENLKTLCNVCHDEVHRVH